MVDESMFNALCDILPMISDEQYFIETDGEMAEKPGIFIVKNSKWYIIIMNHVGEICRFNTKKKAISRVKRLFEEANYPLKAYRLSGKKKILFAVNEVRRVVPKEGCPLKAFNVEEWGDK